MNRLAKMAFGVACAAMVMLTLGAAHAQDILAATVNGAGITVQQVEGGFDEMLKEKGLHLLQVRDPSRVKGMKREVLDRLIERELLWQEARRAGVVASDQEVESAFDEAAKTFKSPERFKLRLEQEGYTEQSYKESIRKVLSGQSYADSVTAKDAEPTQQEVAEFYKSNPDKFHRPEMLRVRHILIGLPVSATKEELAAARRKIEGIRAEALRDKSFEELARTESEDATRQWGGELDPFARGAKPKDFEDAAFKLKPGQISGVVTTAAGLHIIKLEERYPALTISEQDASPRIRAFLESTKRQQARNKLVEELRALAKIEMLLPL